MELYREGVTLVGRALEEEARRDGDPNYAPNPFAYHELADWYERASGNEHRTEPDGVWLMLTHEEFNFIANRILALKISELSLEECVPAKGVVDHIKAIKGE